MVRECIFVGVVASAWGLTLAGIAGCSGGDGRLVDGVGASGPSGMLAVSPEVPVGSSCEVPSEGCSCDQPSATVTCRGAAIQSGAYSHCPVGVRVCGDAGTWGPCLLPVSK